MSTGTVASAVPAAPSSPPEQPGRGFIFLLRDGILLLAGMLGLAALLEIVFKPLLASTGVEEEVTGTLARLLVTLVPYAVYVVVGRRARSLRSNGAGQALLLGLLAIALLFALISAGQYAAKTGPFTGGPSLQLVASQQADGIHVESITPGGAAEIAGIQVGDVITAIRRDEITLQELEQRVSQATIDDPFRLAVVRGGEELQLTVRVAAGTDANLGVLVPHLVGALAVGTAAFLLPSIALPYIILISSLVPLFFGYLWLILATFST